VECGESTGSPCFWLSPSPVVTSVKPFTVAGTAVAVTLLRMVAMTATMRVVFMMESKYLDLRILASVVSL